MSNSRKVGPLRVRRHVRDGTPTGKWFVDIPASLTGSGRRRRKLFDNQRIALEVARELKRRLDPRTGGLMDRTSKSGVLFREAAANWCEDEVLRVETLKKRASTLETDRHRLKALCSFLGGDDVASITERRLVEYQRWRLREGRNPWTINRDLGTFSLVMKWASKQGYISEVPRTQQIPVRPTAQVIPTPEEVVRVIRALPPRLRPIVQFLAETGCRKAEATHLTWDCVDEVNGYVEIRSRDGWTPKTRQSERRVPLSSTLLDMLRGLAKEGPYVFPGRAPDKPIENFRKALRTAVAKADIRRRGKLVHLTPQSFRRAHATWQAMRGVNESVLQDLLGHAPGSRVTQRFYVHATEEAKRSAVLQLPIPEPNGNE